MEKESFRVLLDISNLQDRMHSFVWMLISTLDFKNIADLKNAIIKKLDMNEDRIELFVNGGLLLDEEKIVILRENDTVQVRYEKSQNSFGHNSSSIEVEDRRLSLNSEKSNGAKSVKDSKKHKRRKDSLVQEVDQGLIHHETSLDEGNQVLNDSNHMEVDSHALSLNAEKCSNTTKHSKKHKKRREIHDFPTDEENNRMVQNGIPQDSSTHNSSYVEEQDNKISITAENCKRNITTNFSKTPQKRNDGADLFLAEESKDINLSKKKRKRELASADTFAEVKSLSLSNGSTVESIVSSKEKNKFVLPEISISFGLPNVSALQDFAEDDSKAPCNDYTGIRKHSRFTSPDRKNIAKEIETKEVESNSSSSQSESSPRKMQPSPKCQSLQESIASAIADKVSSKSPNSNTILPSTKAPPLTANGFTQNISSKPNNVPLLTSTKSIVNITNEFIAGLKEIQEKFHEGLSEIKRERSAVPITNYPLARVHPPSAAHIGFKLLELGENYSPEVSDYKEGVIKSINPCNEELEIEHFNTEIKPGRTGKFEILKEDEEPPEEIIEKNRKKFGGQTGDESLTPPKCKQQ